MPHQTRVTRGGTGVRLEARTEVSRRKRKKLRQTHKYTRKPCGRSRILGSSPPSEGLYPAGCGTSIVVWRVGTMDEREKRGYARDPQRQPKLGWATVRKHSHTGVSLATRRRDGLAAPALDGRTPRAFCFLRFRFSCGETQTPSPGFALRINNHRPNTGQVV